MSVIKRFVRAAANTLGYDVRSSAHVGLDAMNDIRTIFGGRAPRLIFDVGAHHGEAALLFAKTFPQAQIHSFEPAPENFPELERHTAAFPNVRAIQAALGSRNEVSTLNLNKSSATNSLLASISTLDDPAAELTQKVASTAITVRMLDSYAADARIDIIDVLKMDVQGFEIEVLRGARQVLAEEKIAVLFCEVSFRRFYQAQPLFEDVYREIAGHGFEFVDLYGHERSPLASIRWCDALFVHPSALAKTLKRP